MADEGLDYQVHIHVGSGVALACDRLGVWCVLSNGHRYDFERTSDYFRLVLMLERPYEEVWQQLEREAGTRGLNPPFPLQNVVLAALKSSSQEWIRRALTWVPSLSEKSNAELREAVVGLIEMKGLPQDIRHLARKYRDRGDV